MSLAPADQFERYKRKGLDARAAGQWEVARVYLLEAARSMLQLARSATSEQLRAARQQTAERLVELAKDCQAARDARRRAPGVSRQQQSAGEKEDAGGGDPSDWIVREKPNIRFDDIAGLEEVKQDIRLRMVYPFQHPDLAEKFAIRPGGGVLLYGPPGTGKTMLAKAVATELDATMFVISPAHVLSKWVGEAEQNLKRLFDAAGGENRSVIFIDEIEALVPARRDEGSSVMQRVVPQILQGMEGFTKSRNPVLFLGATNVPWQLDPAVLRPGRFDEKVYIPLPDRPARLKILQIHLRHRPLDQDVDLPALADVLEGYSGADIRYVCDRAATIPFLHAVATGDEKPISQALLLEVISQVPRSVTAAMLEQFASWQARS
jgi:transitional endoplasmic reticulum ATPase